MNNKEAKLRTVRTARVPAPVGPYSQAVLSDGFLFVAGQLGVDPETSKMVEGGIKEQTRQVLDNLSSIAAEAGASLADVVKTTVFLSNFDEFPQMNEVYAGYFAKNAPARSAIGVARLPLGGAVEIAAVISVGASGHYR